MDPTTPIIANWDSLTTEETIVLPMPVNRTILFALEDSAEVSPDPVAINFPEQDLVELGGEIAALVAAKVADAAQAARGLGGDATSQARSVVYNDILARQTYLIARVQENVNELMKVRTMLAMIRATQ